MATQPIEDMMQEHYTAFKYKNVLAQIANRADAGLYYSKSLHEIKSVLKDIQKLLTETNNGR